MIAPIEPNIPAALQAISAVYEILNDIPPCELGPDLGFDVCEAIDVLDYAMRCLRGGE